MLRILHQESDIGYMPFGYGHRLGANRYNQDFVSETETIVIAVSNQTIRWPTMTNSYPAGEVVSLPTRTLGTRFHPDGKEILWALHEDDEKKSSSVDGSELSVGETEGENFRLVATAEGEVKEFDCRIEFRPTLDFTNSEIQMQLSNTPGRVTIKFSGGIGHHFHSRIESVSVYINGNRQPLTPGQQFNYVKPRPGYGVPGTLNAEVDVQFSEISNSPQLIFKSSVVRDNNHEVYSCIHELSKHGLLQELKLAQNIMINAEFDPPIIPAEDLFATNEDQIKYRLEFDAAEAAAHVKFNVKTNSIDRTVEGPLNKEEFISQKSIQQIVLGSELADVFVVVTPTLDGVFLDDLAKEARLNVETPPPPMLGYSGTDNTTWIEHVINERGQRASRNEVEELLIMFGIEDTEATLVKSEHLRPQLDQILHRQRYRKSAIPNDSQPDSNSDNFTSLLAELFPYNTDRRGPHLTKVRRDEMSANDFLSNLYNTGDEGLKINAEFTGLTHLSPRQQFEIDFSNQIRSANEHVERTVFVMRDTTLRAVLNDDGQRLRTEGGTEIVLRSNFGYRGSSSNKYTAPGTPGIYYLIEQDDTKAYVFEIEVHGREDGDDDE